MNQRRNISEIHSKLNGSWHRLFILESNQTIKTTDATHPTNQKRGPDLGPKWWRKSEHFCKTLRKGIQTKRTATKRSLRSRNQQSAGRTAKYITSSQIFYTLENPIYKTRSAPLLNVHIILLHALSIICNKCEWSIVNFFLFLFIWLILYLLQWLCAG